MNKGGVTPPPGGEHFLSEISEFLKKKLPYNPSIECKEDMVDSKPQPEIRISENMGSLAV